MSPPYLLLTCGINSQPKQDPTIADLTSISPYDRALRDHSSILLQRRALQAAIQEQNRQLNENLLREQLAAKHVTDLRAMEAATTASKSVTTTPVNNGNRRKERRQSRLSIVLSKPLGLARNMTDSSRALLNRASSVRVCTSAHNEGCCCLTNSCPPPHLPLLSELAVERWQPRCTGALDGRLLPVDARL